jgi:hypothetical protein
LPCSLCGKSPIPSAGEEFPPANDSVGPTHSPRQMRQ